MLRWTMIAASTTLLVCSATLGQAPADRPRRVASSNSCYRAEPGSEVGPFPSGTAGCVSRGSLDNYAKLSKAGDRVGIEGLVKRREVFLIDQGTPLLVIAKHFTPSRVEVMSSAAFDRELRSGGTARPSPPIDSLEVRVVEGPHEGKALFVEAESVGLLGLDIVGRRVVLTRPGPAGNFPLLSDMPGVHRLHTAMSAGNLRVAVEMRDGGQLVWVANDVNATVDAADGGAYRVRLLDGPRKGRDGWVDPAYVRIDSTPAAPTDPASKVLGIAKAKADRAASLLSAARNLEKAGKAKAALETYRRVAAEFAGTVSASSAIERVRALDVAAP